MATSESHTMQFDDLNCHVLELIFEHLCIRDFLRVAATCHHFYKLILGNLVLPAAPGAKKRKRTPVSQSKTALFSRSFERYAAVARDMFLVTDTHTPMLTIAECNFPANVAVNIDVRNAVCAWLSNAAVTRMDKLAGLDCLKYIFNLLSVRCVQEYHKLLYGKMAEALRRVATGFARRVPRERAGEPLACLIHANQLIDVETGDLTYLANELTAPGTCFPYKVVSALTSMVMQSIDIPTYLSPTIPRNNAKYLVAQAKHETDEYRNCAL